jgi:hypothetical protein
MLLMLMLRESLYLTQNLIWSVPTCLSYLVIIISLYTRGHCNWDNLVWFHTRSHIYAKRHDFSKDNNTDKDLAPINEVW